MTSVLLDGTASEDVTGAVRNLPDMNALSEKAQRLRALHQPGNPLVLVNAWDVVSAKMIVELGFPAIATSSGAMAWSLGYADGERIPAAEMLAAVKRVTASVAVPVTADLERAYGDPAGTARGAIDAGAVGLNFEDWDGAQLVDLQSQVDRVAAIVQAGGECGVSLVVNARTDVYLERVGDTDAWRFAEAVRRANAYLHAGAACAFIPGVTDEATIERLVKAVDGPVSVLAGAASPHVARLAELGVARISVGTGGASYALACYREYAQRIKNDGDFSLTAKRIPHAETNALFLR